MPDNAVDWAQVAATIVAAAALLWGLWSFRQTSRLQHYTELDRLYFDIVALRIAHTHLGDSDLIAQMAMEQGTERALRYHSYALLVWNFIETIFDRCKQAGLLETWRPILKQEGALHREWFAGNLDKFKPRFRQWARDEIPGLKTLVDSNGMRMPRRFVEPPHYDSTSVDLSEMLVETIATWQGQRGSGIDDTCRNWRTAEALHLVTWHYPHAHAPLSLLLDEERIASMAPAAGAGPAPPMS